MNYRPLLLGALLPILVVACSFQSQSRVNADTNSYSSISVAMPSFEPKSGQTFAWYATPSWSDDAMAAAFPSVPDLLQKTIGSELSRRGYQVSQDKNQADYLIGVVVITEGGARSEDMRDFFKIFPGLPKSAAGFDKGVIAVGIVNGGAKFSSGNRPENADLLWRSALEAFILENQANPVELEKRVTTLSRLLMQRLP